MGIGVVRGLYSVFLSELFESVPRDKVYVIRLEDYKKDKVSSMAALYRWLGLGDPPVEVLRDIHTAGIANFRRSSPQNISRQLLRSLEEFYQPYNEQLAELLHDHKWLWTS